ncbi:hypothetical protein BX666DRAFT_237946 [Dichotomocladium elegans]|nr:hypothetical protein BX666DRAFT_237946 [Dichotomocladium elegans]
MATFRRINLNKGGKCLFHTRPPPFFLCQVWRVGCPLSPKSPCGIWPDLYFLRSSYFSLRQNAMPSAVTTGHEPKAENPTNSPLLTREFETLTNVDDIRESLRQLDEQETRIDSFLDRLLSQESELLDALGALEGLRPQLGTLKTKSSSMMSTILKTSRLAEGISDKVRQLDQEQSRTKDCIQYVENVQELKRCVAGIQEAMQHRDYDTAATLLRSASRIDERILHGSLAEFTVITQIILRSRLRTQNPLCSTSSRSSSTTRSFSATSLISRAISSCSR